MEMRESDVPWRREVVTEIISESSEPGFARMDEKADMERSRT